MAALIEGALALALERNRERLNARVAAARLGGSAIDLASFGEHLQRCVAPAVEAVAQLDEASSDRTAVALFELSLELFSTELFARHPLLDAAWSELLPLVPRVLRYDARRVAGAMTNAIVTLSASSEASSRWLATMKQIAPILSDAQHFFDAGRVTAWRVGMAEYRARALDLLPSLDERIVAAIFGLQSSVRPSELAQALLADRWLDPAAPPAARTRRLIGRAGSFRGFGGEFLAPPRVGRSGGRIIVGSADARWELHADAFGIALSPLRSTETPQASRDFAEMKNFVEVIEPSTTASIDGLTAVTLRYSHSILVFATA